MSVFVRLLVPLLRSREYHNATYRWQAQSSGDKSQNEAGALSVDNRTPEGRLEQVTNLQGTALADAGLIQDTLRVRAKAYRGSPGRSCGSRERAAKGECA
jgi:hypothetical protein